ncbi:hypothetical protein KP509_20G086100 [Ceratopteris richardii]|nr:hypothetical protein KP509_20G086100 [Ceratopteris richardii]
MVSLLLNIGEMCLDQKNFVHLPYKDGNSSSDLIHGYLEHRDYKSALTLYNTIQGEYINPRSCALVGLIKACTKLNDVEQGCKLQAQINQMGILSVDMFVGSALISMYISFCLLEKAEELCRNLPVQNIVAWNVLLEGYINHDQSSKALQCYRKMLHKGVQPNAVTYACILKASISMGALNEAINIHAEIIRRGILKQSLFMGSVLVSMYAKNGMLAKAQEVFDFLPARDVVTWTAIVSGYVQNGKYEEALHFFELMQINGPLPNALTFGCILKACSSIEALEKGLEIHTEVLRLGLSKIDPYIGSALIDMYSKWHMLSRALEAFNSLSVHNVVTWTALISGYVRHNRSEEALEFFGQMQQEGVAPNVATYVCTLKACSNTHNATCGSQIHGEMVKKGLLEKDVMIGSALVDMYTKCGMLIKAKEAFDMLPHRNVVAWSALIMGYTQAGFSEEALHFLGCMYKEGASPNSVTYLASLKACGNIRAIEKGIALHMEIARKGLLTEEVHLGSALIGMYANCGFLAKAREVFDSLLSRNLVTWNTLIDSFTQRDYSEDALYFFEVMKHEAILPNAVTYACVLKACGSIGATLKGLKVHTMIGNDVIKADLVAGSAMINMYSKCGLIHEAQEVFDVIPFRNVVHWGALITGYAQQGEMEVALFLFDKMIKEGNEPDCATFLIILAGCSHTGFIEKGQTYFENMSEVYGIPATVSHHICIVDLLGRAGQLDMAISMMNRAPCHPNSYLWLSMLGACRKWGQVELGRGIFYEAVQSDEKEASAYVCLSNIYADVAAYQDPHEHAETLSS